MMNKTINKGRSRLWKIELFAAALLLLSGMSLSFAQNWKVDINALVLETQKMSQSADDMTILWWVPEEFWRITFEQDPNMTESKVEEMLNPFHPYILIMAINGKAGPLGGVKYNPKAFIQKSIQLIDREGNHYRALSDEEIGTDIKNFLSMMKPGLANMIGPAGQNMHFFLFPRKNKAGRDIAAAKREGAFSIKLEKREFKWRLPLGSLFPLKVCPVDGEKLNGAWKYCPWHGVELK